MNTQPEALRLADVARLSRHHEWHLQVDAELRRLHAENERLHQINWSHEMKLSVRGYEIQIADLEAQRDALLEALQMESLRAALAQPVPHGCHVDLEEGMKPDGCVLDEGSPNKCIYARRLLREGKDKTACEYWKPIEVKR